MTITELKREEYAGKPFTMHYSTTGYYDIQPVDDGFQLQYKSFAQATEMSFTDSFFNDWLEAPIAYGAFENDQLLGYVEGTLEEWNNRYRISNICVFERQSRHRGIGSKLMMLFWQKQNRVVPEWLFWKPRPAMKTLFLSIENTDSLLLVLIFTHIPTPTRTGTRFGLKWERFCNTQFRTNKKARCESNHILLF